MLIYRCHLASLINIWKLEVKLHDQNIQKSYPIWFPILGDNKLEQLCWVFLCWLFTGYLASLVEEIHYIHHGDLTATFKIPILNNKGKCNLQLLLMHAGSLTTRKGEKDLFAGGSLHHLASLI